MKSNKNLKGPICTLVVGVVTCTICVIAGYSLIVCAILMAIISRIAYLLYKGASLGKMYLDSFIIAGVCIVLIAILALLSRKYDIILDILRFPH